MASTGMLVRTRSALAANHRARDCQQAIHKLGAKDNIGVAEPALFWHDVTVSCIPRVSREQNALAAVDGARDGRDAVHELGTEDNVGVAEHALLERDHDELGVGEVRLDHAPDILGVAQVQRGIHLQHPVSIDRANTAGLTDNLLKIVRLDHAPNVLRVAQVQRSIHLQHMMIFRGKKRP